MGLLLASVGLGLTTFSGGAKIFGSFWGASTASDAKKAQLKRDKERWDKAYKHQKNIYGQQEQSYNISLQEMTGNLVEQRNQISEAVRGRTAEAVARSNTGLDALERISSLKNKQRRGIGQSQTAYKKGKNQIDTQILSAQENLRKVRENFEYANKNYKNREKLASDVFWAQGGIQGISASIGLLGGIASGVSNIRDKYPKTPDFKPSNNTPSPTNSAAGYLPPPDFKPSNNIPSPTNSAAGYLSTNIGWDSFWQGVGDIGQGIREESVRSWNTFWDSF